MSSRKLQLDEIIDFNPKRQIRKGIDYPFIEMAAIPEGNRDIAYSFQKEFKGSGSKFKNGDTLFARITPCLENGKTAKVDCLDDGQVAHGSTEFIVLAAKEPEYDEDFVYYLCRWDKFREFARSRMEGTSGRQRVDWKVLAASEWELPEKEERQKIGYILKQIDDKIANNNRINQTLEAMAQALFKSWFVDFEPVKAKMQAMEDGSDPQLAAMCAISGKTAEQLQQLPEDKYKELAATADLFPNKLVESELGLIPEGWKFKSFGELLDKTIGGDWGREAPDEKHTEEVRIIRGTDIPTLQSGGIGKVPTRFVDPKKLKTRKLKRGDIVIEVSGGSKNQPTGRSIMLTYNHIARLGGQAEPASFCRLFRPANEALSYLLGQHLLHIYAEGKTWFYQNQSTGISNFQTAVFLEKEVIPIPKSSILTEFKKKISPIVNSISSNESIKLEQIRDNLIPKLLSGEIDVTI